MTSPKPHSTAERKVFFFRVDIGDDESGSLLPFDPVPALNAIKGLPITDNDSDWYEPEVDGNALCLFSYDLDPYPTARFCRVRRTGLPQLEQAGQVKDLDLEADTGLLEAMHVVFFPKNVVGAEYNHYGPRLSRLGDYLHERSNKAVLRPSFRPILRGDAAEQLERLTDLRVMDISILPTFVDSVRQADSSLANAFSANATVLENPKVLELTFHPNRESQTGFLNKMKTVIRELVGMNGFREESNRFKVRGRCEDSGRVETIDLLKDQLISTKTVIRMNERSRALDPASVFQAICEAYQDLHEQLEDAASVSP